MIPDTIYLFRQFRVEQSTHALFCGNDRLPLQEQPFQVLLALLERPGEVVTREALRLRLWGTSTFVDFDQSLNSAVRRLRLALEDNSRAPIFLETLPRVGFRFLPEVTTLGPGRMSGGAATESPARALPVHAAAASASSRMGLLLRP